MSGSLFLTPKQLAARWDVSVRHVNRMAQQHQFAALKVGKSWRISVASASAYELAHTSGLAIPAAQPAPEPIRPVFGVLAEASGDLVLPERWWESQPTQGAAPSAAGGSRSARTKKTAPQRH